MNHFDSVLFASSFYVQRTHTDGRQGWVGPIRSEKQAEKEAQAWRDCGWKACVLPSTPDIKSAVRDWERSRRSS